MPEGDTVHRTADRLRQALLGAALQRFDAPRLSGPLPAPGTTVERVEARGKHLLLWFGDARVLHTHLRMTGAWHLYPPAATWQRPRSAARVTLTVPETVAVCFDAPVFELLDAAALSRHPGLRELGPDLTTDRPDLDRAVARLAGVAGETPIADALRDQRIATGVGNVYVSELCFLHGLDPRTPVAVVDTGLRRELLSAAHRLLRANLTTPRRTTVPGARAGELWVYGRTGRPCRRCGTAIRRAPVGRHGRPGYWCPRCQPPPPRPAAAGGDD